MPIGLANRPSTLGSLVRQIGIRDMERQAFPKAGPFRLTAVDGQQYQDNQLDFKALLAGYSTSWFQRVSLWLAGELFDISMNGRWKQAITLAARFF